MAFFESRIDPVAVASLSSIGFDPTSTIPIESPPTPYKDRGGFPYSEARRVDAGVIAYQPRPAFQNSPSSLISFFQSGACFFSSEISHEHAEKPSAL